MRKYNNNLFLLILFSFVCIFNAAFAISLPLEIEGDYSIRLPNSGKYIRNYSGKLPDNIIISIPNDNKQASDSIALIDGHRIKLFQGASFKISKGSFIPLLGRFEFNSDETATNTISIVANNCNAGYSYGNFFIEVTPDNGVFFALKNKGNAWVKDVNRRVFELKQGQQVQVPLFGASVLRNHVEAFWGKEPSSFGHLGEVGQETAYGIVGKESSVTNKTKTEQEDSELDNDEEEDEESEESEDANEAEETDDSE